MVSPQPDANTSIHAQAYQQTILLRKNNIIFKNQPTSRKKKPSQTDPQRPIITTLLLMIKLERPDFHTRAQFMHWSPEIVPWVFLCLSADADADAIAYLSNYGSKAHIIVCRLANYSKRTTSNKICAQMMNQTCTSNGAHSQIIE